MSNKGKVIHADFSAVPCAYCGKPAGYLCDMPVREHKWCGHPPREEIERGNVSMTWHETCNKPMCDECAIFLGSGVHICHECAHHVKDSFKAYEEGEGCD